MEMHSPMHPGEFLNDIYLEPYHIAPAELADRLEVDATRIADLVAQKASVDADLAIRLAAVLGGTARFWTNMQAGFDIARARAVFDVSHLRPMSFPELEEVPDPDKYYS